MEDSLGDRMKNQYENRTRFYLPRRTYTLIRVDGKAFHNYTKGCERPFDKNLMTAMDHTSKALCENLQGCKLAYVQSDEITLVLTDFDSIITSAWFDGNLQKIVSITASMATAYFNQIRIEQGCSGIAMFDARAWTMADREEVLNNLIWRQQDASRNSVQMAARTYYSHKETENKNNPALQEMLFSKGINWNEYPIGCKRGRIIKKNRFLVGETERSEWIVDEPPIFTQNRQYLYDLIPAIG